ncbi:sel1 repeat family protein [Siculibacillus lacustris]|uniref:Sel1 repeat family protein n=2 Tax=Siculibacillus lacustris TaxID=1549641 RepID=A0A4Q9VJT6_9HYPH|nr:sel1 repeat family protein [Siculibacillus lacustris]
MVGAAVRTAGGGDGRQRSRLARRGGRHRRRIRGAARRRLEPRGRPGRGGRGGRAPPRRARRPGRDQAMTLARAGSLALRCAVAILAGGLIAAGDPPKKPTAARPAAPRGTAAPVPLPRAAFTPAMTGLPVAVPLPTLAGSTLTPVPSGDEPGADPVYAAFQRGLWVSAFAQAIPRAEAGDAAAMTMLGTLYETGLGVPRKAEKAAEWYRLAADRGDREAAAALAQMLLDGRGIARDRRRAFALFQTAAEKDQPVALYDAAVMLLDGSVTARDPARAAAYLGRAAALGNVDAQYAYATLLSDPEAPGADPVAAAKWMREAAMAGFEAAEVEWGLMLANGRGVAKDIDSAFVWLHRSALRGNAIGRNRLARMYATGLGAGFDPVEAWKWHMLAKRQGLSDLWLETRLSNLSADDRRRAEAAADAIDGEAATIAPARPGPEDDLDDPAAPAPKEAPPAAR